MKNIPIIIPDNTPVVVFLGMLEESSLFVWIISWPLEDKISPEKLWPFNCSDAPSSRDKSDLHTFSSVLFKYSSNIPLISLSTKISQVLLNCS